MLQLDDGPLLHMVRLARDVGTGGARAGTARLPRPASASPARWCSSAVGTLSGGEKARLVLAMLVWQRPNLLLLDEPTNHLDLTTREALSMALNEFEGTVMLVSHDRALLREVCDEFWLVTGGARAALRRRPRRLPALAARGVARDRARPSAPPAPSGGADAGAEAATPAQRATPSAPTPRAPAATAASPPARRDDRKQPAQARAQLANRTRPLAHGDCSRSTSASRS